METGQIYKIIVKGHDEVVYVDCTGIDLKTEWHIIV